MLARDAWSSWESYTPTFSAGTGVIGNGSTQGRYKRWGLNALWEVLLTVGSTTTFQAGQSILMTLPAELVRRAGSHLGNTGRVLGSCYFIDDSNHANSRSGIVTIGDGGNTISFVPTASTGNAATDTTPFTWAVNDRLIGWGACPIEGW